LILKYGKIKDGITVITTLKTLNLALFGVVATSQLKKVNEFNLQLFSFGYDNAFHFAIFRYFRGSTWFPFGFESDWGTDFEMFRTYPTGQAALWSFFTEPLIGNSTNAEDSLAAYTFLLIACYSLMVYFVYRQIKPTAGNVANRVVVPLVFSVLINFAFASILFTNGFLPYFTGLLCLLVAVDSKDQIQNSFYKIASMALLTLILVLVSPALIAFIVIPVIVTTFTQLKKMLAFQEYSSVIISLIFGSLMLLLIFWTSQRTSSTYGWRQILAEGGIRQPSIIQALAVFSGYLAIVILQRKKQLTDVLMLVSASGLISVIGLVALTVFFTGSIQYYAVKQAYVALAICSIVLARDLLKLNLHKQLRLPLLAVLSLILILPNVIPRALNSGFMGALSGVVTHTLQKDEWDLEVVDANHILAGLKAGSSWSRGETPCLILRHKPFESDLNSRWLNALTPEPNISNFCFAGFWNSTSLSMSELVERLGRIPGTFTVVIDQFETESLPTELPQNLTFKLIGKVN
jgi:hypothetical protein